MNNTIAAIRRKAIYFAGQLTQMMKKNAPNHLKGAIKSSTKDNGNGTYMITTTVSKPDALAQEYGSGLKATRGARHTYSIEPKNKKALAFTGKDGGWVVTQHVDHPGIEPFRGVGYARISLEEVRKRMRKELSAEILRAIKLDIRASFIAPNRK
jgi:hypothetical protein